MGTVLILLAAAGCAGEAGNETGTEADQRAQVLLPADLATAERSTLDESVVLTGSLEPYRVVSLTAQVPGTLVRLYADRGDPVGRGDPLAVIQAAGIRGMADAAAQQLEVARQSLEGARSLHEAGAMSDIDFESARAAFEQARAAAASASENADRATMTSPLDGVVSARWVSEGEPVNPGQPVFTVVDTRILELRGNLPVDDAMRVHPGQVVTFEVNGYAGKTFEGTVARVEPTADTQTRQVGVYARLDNADRAMPGGLFARGRVAVDRLEDVVVVPQTAVRATPAGPVVYVLDGGAIRHRSVETGPVDRARRVQAILSGLDAGEQVVVTPTVEVADGTPAQVETLSAVEH
jgi:RND family efflux transporter MFP subunit